MVRVKKNDIDQFNRPFPTILRKHLEEPGMTQQLLADYIGVKRQTVAQWKDGQTSPDIESLSKIADFFEASTDYLLGRTDVKKADLNIQQINKVTGLSEEAITNIIEYCFVDDLESGERLKKGSLVALNKLLEDIDFFMLLAQIYMYSEIYAENKVFYHMQQSKKKEGNIFEVYEQLVDSYEGKQFTLNPAEYYEYMTIELSQQFTSLIGSLAEEHIGKIENIEEVVKGRDFSLMQNKR